MANAFKNIGVKPAATVVFFVFHFVLAIICKNYSVLATLHAFIVLFLGIGSVLLWKEDLTLYTIVYIVAAEVFWRMMGAAVLWEFGKYLIIGICLFSIFLNKRGKISSVLFLSLYFIFLLPAILWTPYETFNTWRQLISFSMSGPVSLIVCGFYFSRKIINKKQFKKLLVFCAAPAISIAAFCLLSLRSSFSLNWGTQSLAQASGGFGPNQVSSILGFSGFILFMLFIFENKKKSLKAIYLFLLIWFFIQSILTFSRAGPIQLILGVGIFMVTLMLKKSSKYLLSFIILITIFLLGLTNYLLPKLDDYTKGNLRKRYGETERVGDKEVIASTGRLALMSNDIEIFYKNLLGIGVGMSPEKHAEVTGGIPLAAHTEWTRILAEHGVFGLFSILFLIIWLSKRVKQYKTAESKAIALSLLAFSVIYMFQSAMRGVLPGVFLGFLAVQMKLEGDAE